MNALKGWRTVGFGLLVAVVPTGLTYLAGVHWTDYVSPNAALAISGLITIGLRAVTTTSIGSKA